MRLLINKKLDYSIHLLYYRLFLIPHINIGIWIRYLFNSISFSYPIIYFSISFTCISVITDMVSTSTGAHPLDKSLKGMGEPWIIVP